MKRLVTIFGIMATVLLSVACGKDAMTPEELANDPDKAAQAHFQSGSFVSDVTFGTATVTRSNDMEESSLFNVTSNGNMVYDYFTLNIYFSNLDKLSAGDDIEPSDFMFMLPLSSDSANYTSAYSGTISLASKGEDYIILQFKDLAVDVPLGSYKINGYLKCEILEEGLFK